MWAVVCLSAMHLGDDCAELSTLSHCLCAGRTRTLDRYYLPSSRT